MDIDSSSNYESKTDNIDSVGKVTGFFLFKNLINKYNEAKNSSDEERKQIKKYGILSIILSVIAIIISGSLLLSTFMDFQFFGFSYVLLILVYVLGGVIVCLVLSVYAFVFAVMQVRLNRKAVGIFGIILSVVGVIVSLFLIIFLFI